MTKPLYDKLKTAIRERIGSGQYTPGSLIPSTSALAKEFDVSVITVRRAIQDLAVEGKLVGLPGKGTYVTGRPRVVRSLGQNFMVSFGEEMRRAGMSPSIEELSLSLVEPTEATKASLQTRAGGLVYLHEKIILADEVPVCYDRTYFPERFGRTIIADLKNKFSLEILVDRKIQIDYFKCQMQSGAATPAEAQALRISAGSPVLKMLLMPLKPSGQAIFVGDFVFPSDWFAFEFDVPAPLPR
jgi:GntR family transcriptional regulator